MAELPTGTVTFWMTDVEESTRRWRESPQAMGEAIARHDILGENAVAAHNGILFKEKGEGDSHFAVFPRASDAVAAALAFQQALHAENWPTAEPLRVRIGVHTGEAELRDGDYFGLAPALCARLRNAASGGQVFLSRATVELAGGALPESATIREHGPYYLPSFDQPVEIFQLDHPAMLTVALPPRSLQPSGPGVARLTRFFGREEEISRIVELFREARLVTLTGPGGSGKTRLAEKVAVELAAGYPDGVWFVSLVDLRDGARVAEAVATAVKAGELPGGTAEEGVVRHLERRRGLLILDNCEHLLEAARGLARRLLERCASLSILATARERMGIAGEHVWKVEPLPAPPSADLPPAELLAYPAVALFVDRARSADPAFTLGSEDAGAVLEICRRVAGMPLAIELVASHAPYLTVHEIAESLVEGIQLPEPGLPPVDIRQRTLRAVFDWDHDLLAEPDRALFRRLSAFAGGWSRKAAEAVCGFDPLPPAYVMTGLPRLVRKSLVEAHDWGREKRYRFLAPVREYTREKLMDSGEEPALTDRHATYFSEFALEAEPHIQSSEAKVWLDRLETDHDNLRAALRNTLDPERRLRLATALHRFWFAHGHLHEGRSWLENAVRRAVSADPLARAKGNNAAGVLAWAQGDFAAARPFYEEALRLYSELGQPRGKAGALNNLAILFSQSGDPASARGCYEEAVALFRTLGEEKLAANVLANLGAVTLDQADLPAARSYLEEALCELNRLNAEALSVADALQNLGSVERLQGDLEAAGRHLRESLAIRAEMQDERGIGLCLTNLGYLAYATGANERAACLLAAGQRIREQEGIKLSPAEQAEFDGVVTSLRAALGSAAFRRAWSKGASMSLEKIVAFALAEQPEDE